MANIDWDFKEDVEAQGSSSGFWYDITMGGYVDPEAVLSDESQLAELEDAIETVRSFENALEAADLLNEF